MTTQTLNASKPRLPLSALAKVNIAALTGVALAYLFLVLVLIGGFAPMIVMTPVFLLLAALVALHFRWAPLLGALACVAGFLPEAPLIRGHLDDDTASFLLNIVVIPLLFAAGASSGILATLQKRQAQPQTTPRYLPVVLYVLAGVLVGATAVALLRQAPASTLNDKALAALPVVVTENFQFQPKEIRVKAGELVMLRLENRDPVAHRFDIDELDVHESMFHGEPGMAVFTPSAPGVYEFYCDLPGHREHMRGKLGNGSSENASSTLEVVAVQKQM